MIRDNGMRLWNLIADENAIITSHDLSPSLRLRNSVAQRVQSFQNASSATTSITSVPALLPYERQVRPTLLVTPPNHNSSHSSHSSYSSPPSNTPRRVALQALVERKNNELNILRQELLREEAQHQNARCELSSYKELVHDFCVLQVRTHRHANR